MQTSRTLLKAMEGRRDIDYSCCARLAPCGKAFYERKDVEIVPELVEVELPREWNRS